MKSSITTFNGFFFTSTAAYIPRVTGTASVMSSFLIMYMIMSSETKLGTTYHRIIFLMSLCDAAASMAMSLTTLPMPKDVQSVYPFETRTLGNTITCEIQGFVYQSGTHLVIFLNLMLHFYYLCMIRYNVRKSFFARYLEPLLLITGVILSLISPILTLKYGRMNPTVYEPFCSSGPYPWTCTVKEDETCIRGDNVPETANNIIKWYFVSVIGIGLVITVTFMILILLKVYRGGAPLCCQRRRITRNRRLALQNSDNLESNESAGMSPQQTKIVTCQALMYVTAFILTYLFTVLSFVLDTNTIHCLKLIFQPMQGLFNAIIFVYDKVQSLRRHDRNLTLCESLQITIVSPRQAPEMFLSSIEIVDGRRASGGSGENSQAEEVIPPRRIMRRSGACLRDIEERLRSQENVAQDEEESDVEQNVGPEGNEMEMVPVSLDVSDGDAKESDSQIDNVTPPSTRG